MEEGVQPLGKCQIPEARRMTENAFQPPGEEECSPVRDFLKVFEAVM